MSSTTVLRAPTCASKPPVVERLPDSGIPAFRPFLDSIERALIRKAIEQTGGRLHAASRLLGIPRPTLYARIASLGIQDDLDAARGWAS